MDLTEEEAGADEDDAGKETASNGLNKPETASSAAGQQDLSTNLRIATDRVLQFLSSATNETLGACIVGLGATTYLILGRVGLLLIGAVGGIALHASWERSQNGDDGKIEHLRRREVGLDVARRVLEWRQARSSGLAQLSAGEEDPAMATQATNFSDFPAETAKALNVFTEAVIRDYVYWWYSPILPTEEKFPAVSRATFSSFLLSISNHIARKRPTEAFLEFSTNSSSILIVFLNELSTAFYASPTSTPDVAIETYLQSNPDSNLANITDEEQQQRKLLAVADDILENYLEAKVYICPPARVFLREVLANLVLSMTLSRCSQDDWINEWIVYLLEEGEPELLNALDAGVDSPAIRKVAGANHKVVEASANASRPEDAMADHKRTQSRAQEAMEEAMHEAEKMNKMIADEEARISGEHTLSSALVVDAISDSIETQGVQTPALSQDGMHGENEAKTGLDDDPAPSSFTSFDQIIPRSIPTALMEDVSASPGRRVDVLTLHKAQISIFDNGMPGDKRALKSKPTDEYMIQIEPASSTFPGWMIPRTYADFEPLHEVLRRISTIAGTVAFTEAHAQLPAWKGRTSSQLTQELERYLLDATQFEPLAESEGMKKFLERDRGLTNKSPKGKGGFWAGPAALETVGKGVFDVLSKAPKGVAGGGKAVLGGVTSVFGGAAGPPARSLPSPRQPGRQAQVPFDSTRASTSIPANNRTASIDTGVRQSTDLPRTSTSEVTSARSSRPSSTFGKSQSSLTVESDHASSAQTTQALMNASEIDPTPQYNLPPPPSDIPDDYAFPNGPSRSQPQSPMPSRDLQTSQSVPDQLHPARQKREDTPLSSKETTIAIELLFAVINELYTLSSAWSLRRTLLNAAKSYLLRPGNVQLESIRQLIQESVLDANTSDAGIAAQIYKVRENALPTEEELNAWPKPRTQIEKDALRVKARALLVQRGMPQALTSVMGTAASGEALGRVFDALQVEKVARGLIFGLMLQALRTAVQ